MLHVSHVLQPDEIPTRSTEFDLDTLPREPNGGLPRRYCKGELLFIEGGVASGVFVVREGRVKVSTTSAGGRSVIVKIAGPGDMLGLAAVLAPGEYAATAEALEKCSADFISRDHFLAQMSDDPEAARHAAEQLARDYLAALGAVSSLVSADSVLVRLARLFLSWTPKAEAGSIRLTNHFTHQQLAEMIGTTRETVTRALGEMRERDLATLKGGELVIHHHERLRLITANGNGHCDLAHRQATAE